MTEKPEIHTHSQTFDVLDESGVGLTGGESLLDERERALVVGAANFHALTRPGQTIRFTVLRGPQGSLPSLTDRETGAIEWEDDREVVGSVVFRSLVHTTVAAVDADGLVDLVVDVGGSEQTASAYHQLPGLAGALRRAVRFTVPVQFDALRQYRTDLVEKRYRARDVPRKAGVRIARGASATDQGRTPAVLFGIHWLELGGAERWAVETVQLAKDAGLTPVIITDRPSGHPWITRPEFDGAVVVPLTLPLTPDHESMLLNGIMANYDVRGVHVHHCTWLYERLPWLKAIRPDIPVVDSLHILEWRTGGFVDISVRVSNVVDRHHVISPQLRDYLIGKQGIPAEKVALATLANLTAAADQPAKAVAADKPFTVAFVGRFTQQKRPYLFLKLAAELKDSAPGPVRFVMHGDGELSGEVHGLRGRLGLSEALELRGPDRDVSDTLAEADVLVISSDNEGLTLTSFEASAAGIPVVSTDVGSQASLIADGLLCPRHPYPFIRTAAARIGTMMDSPEQRERWLVEQRRKSAAFAALPDARSWVRDLYRGWNS
ncbi:Glycosyltransferase [Actinokineospora spheciospongiae]|uniref:Glycosyltransferase n=1 Tax=Actinokineospora spheciospongiae TaxID=909613 RepID=W7IMY8_9PSEU|nr:glycosyltransferase [Actinokineospora spheciospongiae]EWC61758.1 Glycosyltransferase [Actinokineospora spheciospongiae]PWW62100.1 glycosyltransferase involved in cell wall biosynthesis [Actinokineospora spheciospongiae]